MHGILLKHIDDLKRTCLDELKASASVDGQLHILENLNQARKLEKDIYGP